MSLQRRLMTDFWTDVVISQNSSIQGPFSGVSVLTGTSTSAAAVVSATMPYGLLLRSSTTANSGWKIQTSAIANDYFGLQKRKYRQKLAWPAVFTGTTVRHGFHDTGTVADAVDGAYFEIIANVAAAKTAANSVRTQAATTYTLTAGVPYTFDIDVNAIGNAARFRIFADQSETPVFDQTITTNIPNGSGRSFGAGIVATNSGTVAVDLVNVYYMGYGSFFPDETLQETVAVLTGTTPVLSSFAGTIQTWTLTANSAPTDGLADGQSMVLLVDDGTAFTVTWPTITWVNGVAPVLKATGFTLINLFKAGGVLYGAF